MLVLEALEGSIWQALISSANRHRLELIRCRMESTGVKCRITGGIA